MTKQETCDLCGGPCEPGFLCDACDWPTDPKELRRALTSALSRIAAREGRAVARRMAQGVFRHSKRCVTAQA
jgi:hypothetical protein